MAKKQSKEDQIWTDDEIFRLREELKMAEKLNEQELGPQMVEALQRYTGRWIPSIAKDWTIVLNEIYPVVQFNLPSIFFRTPRAFLKPKNKHFIAKRRDPISGRMEEVQLDATKSARTQEAIINYTLEEIRYKNEVRKVLLDALIFRHGVMWHGYKGEFGMTEEKSMFIKNDNVFVMQVNPLEFLFDPSVTLETVDQGRWVARIVDLPIEDLIEDDKLFIDRKQIQGMPGFGQKVGTKDLLDEQKMSGGDKIHTAGLFKPLLDFTSEEFKKSPFTRFVRCYEIFKRPTKKERREGIKGKILFMTMEQKEPMRADRWLYSAEGFPAKVLQFNPVPKQPFGISDMEVYASIADHKNLIINQQIRNAEQLNKQIIGVSKEGADEEDLAKLKRGENTIVEFEDTDGKGIASKFFVATLGSSSSELFLVDQRIDKNLQDKSGVSDLKKGFVQSGEESATSIRARTAGASARPAYRQDQMSDFLKDSIKFLNQLLKQFYPVKKAVRIVGSTDIEWSDEFTKEEIQAEVDVDIDVISMLPENPEKELRELGEVLGLIVQGLGDPNVSEKLRQEGKTFNISPIIENMLLRLRIRDPEVFRGIRPEESQGFVSRAELQAAQQNIVAALQGQPPPDPPDPNGNQDHIARLEVYISVKNLLQALQQETQILDQLIEAHTAILQEIESKENPRSGQKVPPASSAPGIQPFQSLQQGA